MARGVLADRDALRVHNEALRGLADETTRAAVAAADYAKKRDLVAPIVRVVRVKSDPIVKILDSCALPADAGRLLDCSALAADSKAGADDPAYAACAALADRVRQADVGRSVPADD
jgi:hypothetical protein